MSKIYNIKPDRNRYGMNYGNNNGWHWYDIVIGILIFIAVITIKSIL